MIQKQTLNQKLKTSSLAQMKSLQSKLSHPENQNQGSIMGSVKSMTQLIYHGHGQQVLKK